MRYRGRVKVSKVDQNGKRIKSVAQYKIKNPGKLCFDSKTEWECWAYMKTTGLIWEFQKKVDLFSGMTTQEFKSGEIKDVKQRAISYTPDFYLTDYDVYIEVKGYADPLFKLRWKLFKIQGNKGYIVYSVDELKLLVKELEN